jgi:predicted Zn-dependent peptidase
MGYLNMIIARIGTVASLTLLVACATTQTGASESMPSARPQSIDPASLPLGDGVTLPAYERVVLNNGIELFLIEKHDVPLISFDVTLRGGSMADPMGLDGAGSLLADLLERGAGERDALAFAEAQAAVGGGLTTYATNEYLGVFGQFMAKDRALMIELLADLLMRPTLDADEFEQLRSNRIDALIAAKDESPQSLIGSYFEAMVFADHPFARRVGGDETSLAAITLEDLRSYYAEHVGADRMQITVAGAFDPAAVSALISEAFGGWRPAAADAPSAPAVDALTTGRVLLVDMPGAAQTYFRFGRLGLDTHFEDQATLDLVNTAFGGRFTSMLNTALRIESGLTYGASSRFWQPGSTGTFYISSFTETSTTQEALDLALAVLDRLHSEGLDQATLSSVQAYTLGQFAPDFETAVDISDAVMEIEFYGTGTDSVDGYGDAVKAATLADARRIIDEIYPTRDEMVLVLIGDADEIREIAAMYGDVTEMSISEPRFTP